MELNKKRKILICVIILMNLKVTNCVRKDKKCAKVLDFHGGSVFYDGERKVDSQAFYSCRQAFSLFPSHVDFSECGKNLKWKPKPPKCYRKATLRVPSNGYIFEGKKDFLLHLESYKVCCEQGFEVQSDGKMVSKSCIWIKNVKGVLTPRVQCVEEGCDPNKYKRSDIKFMNGSLVKTKIPSRTIVILTCKAGYGFYKYGTPMRPQLKRTCVKGEIVRARRCQEAMCLFSGYPSTRYTYHREYLSDAVLIAEDQYVDARQAVQVYCYRTDIFELYVNASQTYPKHFTTECRYGKFDKKKEEFPICIEKGCDFHVSNESCFLMDDQGSCNPSDFKISSGTSLLMGCKSGFRLYRSENGLAVEANESVLVTCRRGSYNSLEGYKCIPDDLVKVLEGQSDRFPEELGRVSCRFLILKSDFCSDPCLIPNIPSGYVKQTQSKDQIEFETGHNTSVTFICEEGFHFEQANSTLVGSFENTCNLGEWTNLISITCNPDPCDLQVSEGTSYFNGSIFLSGNDGHVHSLQNGTEIEVVCKNGYKMKGENTTGTDDRRRYSTCVKGQWTHNYHCIPEECSAPEVINALLLKKEVYGHSENITIICEEGFHFYQNLTNVVRSVKSECNFGQWTNSFPEECKPDLCHLKILEGTSFFNGSIFLSGNDGQVHSLQNGTEIEVVCKNGYKMKGDNTTGTDDRRRYSTCVKGQWSHNYHCIPEECSAPEVINALLLKKEVYGHSENITIICEEGFHFYQTLTNVVRSVKSECNFGKWTDAFPEECKPDLCHLKVLEGTSFFNGSNLLSDNDGDVYILQNGTEIEVKCKNGYKMKGENTTDNYRRYLTCEKGHLTHTNHCIPEECPAPVVMNTISVLKVVYAHTEMIKLTCEEGFHFYQNITTVVRSVKSECNLGKWINEIPQECKPDSCILDILEGSAYLEAENNVTLTDTGLQSNGTAIRLMCLEEFDLYDNENENIIEDLNNVTITCYYGDWDTDYYCRKRCILPNDTYVKNIQNGTYVTMHNGTLKKIQIGKIVESVQNGTYVTMPNGTNVKDIQNGTYVIDGEETFVHGESVTVTCEGHADNDALSIKCDNGHWQPEVNCNVVGTASSTAIESTTVRLTISSDDTKRESECKLSSDPRYRYKDNEGVDTKPGTTISNGVSLIVTCAIFDDGFLQDDYYDDYETENETTSTTVNVTCTENKLTPFKLNCQELKEDKCMEIEHGDVKKENDGFLVTCHVGFTLDANKGTKYTCENGKLEIMYGEKEPVCKPDNCIVPYKKDTMIKVTNANGVLLIEGSVVNTEEVVSFDCLISAPDSMLEPNDRKFKCLNGQWIEDDKDIDWKFGNNGLFPECRGAKCEPECQNGGLCYKDNFCHCLNSTKGPRCEKFTCLLPNNAANVINQIKKVFDVGETIGSFYCDTNYKLSSQDNMTCQHDGTWSTVVECIEDENEKCKNLFYGRKWKPKKSISRYMLFHRRSVTFNDCK